MSAIRELNDKMRTAVFSPLGRFAMTDGVAAKGPEFQRQAVQAVRSFSGFNDANDPHGEHDFGSFYLGGEKLLWKIDYYDRNLEYGSEDPADPTVTMRVLTIMLAEEY